MEIGVPVLRSLGATTVELHMKRPLGTSTKTIDRACLLLIDLLTQDGIEGHAYAFCYQHDQATVWGRTALVAGFCAADGRFQSSSNVFARDAIRTRARR
jgi:hypothetical protein